jgi:hypothetical protein
MSWIATGIAAAGAISQFASGASQRSAAKKDAKGNIRPSFTIPKEWFDNENLAETQAQYGLTAPALDYYTTQSQRGLSSGLDAALRSGGSVNTLSGLYDGYNDGINKIAAEDAQLKNQNIINLIKAKSDLGNEREKAWTLNYYEPYKDRAKADTAQEAAGTQTMYNGISGLASAVAAGSQSNDYAQTSGKPQTFGERTGAPVLAPATGASFSGITPTPLTDTFSTPGGNAVLEQMFNNNPNSPYIQDLLFKLQKT